MVGKVKHVRQRLHQEPVRPLGAPVRPPPWTPVRPPSWASVRPPPGAPGGLTEAPGEGFTGAPKSALLKSILKGPSSFPTAVFAGTRISPEALVQTLQLDPPPPDLVLQVKKGQEEKRVMPKKEKLKERRERWLNKISSIKRAREQQAALARRQATPVVGDMRALADALPELSELIGPASAAAAPGRRNRKSRAPVKKRPEPTDFTLMKQSQKRKLLETEMLRFGEAVRSLASRSDPLADIGEQLRKRMRQQEEGHQGPS